LIHNFTPFNLPSSPEMGKGKVFSLFREEDLGEE